MSNHLKMATSQAIQQLQSLGWSQRRIARELGIDRETVKRHLNLLQNATGGGSKPATAPTGSEGSKPATFVPSPGPSGSAGGVAGFETGEAPTGFSASNDPEEGTVPAPPAEPVEAPTVVDSGSQCAPYRDWIQAKLEQGLSATRIHRDLREEHKVTFSYYSVRRFIQQLTAVTPLPFRRLECAAGEEAQVDFGTGAPVVGADGKRRKTYVFRIVLSHSRKGYSEATHTQTTEDFFRCLENAFAHFGGVPKTLVIDYVPRHIIDVLCPRPLCGQFVQFPSFAVNLLVLWAHNGLA